MRSSLWMLSAQFVVPLAGIQVAIERTYDRLISGDFGYGWELGIDAMRLATWPAASTVTLTVGGQRRTFDFAAQPNALFQFYHTPGWVAEAGLDGTLRGLHQAALTEMGKSQGRRQRGFARARGTFTPAAPLRCSASRGSPHR